MTGYIYRVALIVPDAVVEAARRIAAAMGWGENCYAVPLASNPQGPATHWGLSTAARQSFLDLMQSAGSGAVPEGIDAIDLQAVMPVLQMAVASVATSPVVQFKELCAANGLVEVETG
ncbi:hypothetical protein [Ruegeria arenilitoris]|uniref:hypothetical protein n=1 Tax=Ruegeria arenilitoris TaxID=1173585 RepID=UPI00147F6362|nr:hypothetical protein [Ruegeria arenilitoris]